MICKQDQMFSLICFPNFVHKFLLVCTVEKEIVFVKKIVDSEFKTGAHEPIKGEDFGTWQIRN